jgi:hypothetical protein
MATGKSERQEDVSLTQILALAMRHAREAQGFGFGRVDQAIAQALLIEAAQRAALAAGNPIEVMPPKADVAEIFEVVVEDIKTAGLRQIRGRLN